jgi:hypothetical protein
MKLKDVIFIILAIVAVSIALRYLTFTGFGWNQWLLVTANVIFFTLFFVLLQYRRKLPRLPSSIYLAFIVALYAEMFGLPLTMYILMGVFGLPDIYNLEFLLTQVMGEQQFHIIFHYYVFPASQVIIVYYRLAKKEEKDAEEEFGEEYLKYKRSVPGWIPRIRRKADS